MSIRAVFLIKSPLQFLNALEAQHHFKLSAEECLLVLMADRKSRGQLSMLVDKESAGWSQVLWLAKAPLKMVPGAMGEIPQSGSSCRNDLFSIYKLRYLARYYDSLDYVFIGDAGNPLMRHFANYSQPQNVVLLDDGVATIKYARWRSAGQWGKGLRRSKKVNLTLKRKLLGLRDSMPSAVTFFSVYNFNVIGSDRLVSNQLSCLRRRASELERCNDIFFLGGPLVEAGILSEEEYFWHLQKVCDHFKGSPVRYVVHRRENSERVKRIEDAFGWRGVLFDFPIEYQIACAGPHPKLLASFVSSALENCQKVFGDSLPIVSFRFNPEHFSALDSVKGQEVKAVYDRYQAASSAAFEVLNL